jgi:hypothetical protein
MARGTLVSSLSYWRRKKKLNHLTSVPLLPLQSVILRNAHVNEANFEGANIDGAHFEGTRIQRAKLMDKAVGSPRKDPVSRRATTTSGNERT